MKIFRRTIVCDNDRPMVRDIAKESRENQQKIAAIKKRVGENIDNIRHPVPFGTQLSR